MTGEKKRRVVLRSLAEIPAFANEDEEAHFWDTHEFSDKLMASFNPTPVGRLPPTRPPLRPSVHGHNEQVLNQGKLKKTAAKVKPARRAKAKKDSRTTTVHHEVIDARRFGRDAAFRPAAKLDQHKP